MDKGFCSPHQPLFEILPKITAGLLLLAVLKRRKQNLLRFSSLMVDSEFTTQQNKGFLQVIPHRHSGLLVRQKIIKVINNLAK